MGLDFTVCVLACVLEVEVWNFLSKAEVLGTDFRQGLNSGIVLFKTFYKSCSRHSVAGAMLPRNVMSLSKTKQTPKQINN